MVDVAIIGAGVSGCYSAYRLANDRPGEDVQLFEMSNRIGGRLWSEELKGQTAPIDIGGMYFKSRQTNVFALIEYLALDKEEVTLDRSHHFLRGQYLTDADYANPGKIPFKLKESEQEKDPIRLILHALEQMLPGFMDLWPINKQAPRSPEATLRRLRTWRHDGRPLHKCGFWNVMADRVSNEAYAILTSAVGSIALFRNVNAFDGIWNLMHELAEGRGYRLKKGYDALTDEMVRLAKKNEKFSVSLGHKLRYVRREGDLFRLGFFTDDGYKVVFAKKVILALPRRALQKIYVHRDLFKGDVATYLDYRDNAVVPMRSCKVFLTFSSAWWNASNFGPGRQNASVVTAAYTDLPMQQCYYFGKVNDSDRPLLMAAYADDYAASFWGPLDDPDTPTYKNPVISPDGAAALAGSPEMAAAAQQQLGVMHYDVKAPEPESIAFWDWGRDPYGAAWHGWAPRYKSWQVRPYMRQPNPDLNFFICGEAYSQRGGWVEGAINSAEMVLERMGLGRPDWVKNFPNFKFEIDDVGEENMTTGLELLVLALTESLHLQAAYRKDPEGIMSGFGLSKDEIEALVNADYKEVKKMTGGGGLSVCFLLVGG